MVSVKIRGKEFPLCMTVAALDEVNKKCGGLNNLQDFLDGGGDTGKSLVNTAWALGLLIQEGEENRIVLSMFGEKKAERNRVPTPEEISHLMTLSEISRHRATVIQAVNESMHQEIEAAPSKNGSSAEPA